MGKHSIEKRQSIARPSLSDLRLRLAASGATSTTTRRVQLGAAAGGLLGMAFLPLAVAHADYWTITPDPQPTETVTGIYGHGFGGGYTVPPAVEGSVEGDQLFDYNDTTTGATGTFYGFESYSNDSLTDLNATVYVASAPTDGIYSDAGGTGEPPVGSVFDSYSSDDGLYTNLYSAIPNGDGTATVTDTLVTPVGNIEIPIAFDAADISVADAGGVATGNGGTIDPLGSSELTSVSGIAPLTIAMQGSQVFGVLDSADESIGHVAAVDTTTADLAGNYTEAVLVTSDNGLTNIGTSAADLPAVGSIFNTIDFFGFRNVYADYVSPEGDQYSDTVYSPFGNYVIPIAFDAANVEDVSNSSITIPNGMTFDPTTTLGFTGVNGLPPVDVGVQGGQDFDFTDGGTTGSFTADVTNTLDEFNNTTETILVTSTSDAAALPQGSEFEIVNFGYGFESIYSDIAGATASQDVVSETLVTPFGDVSSPPAFDVAAQLIGDMFHVFAGGDVLSGL